MSQPFVSVLMGSDSDLPIMEASFEILRKFKLLLRIVLQRQRMTLSLMRISADVQLLYARLEWQLTSRGQYLRQH